LLNKNSIVNAVAVIPTLNEEKNVYEILKETEKYVDKIIVVDSSTDKTPKIIKTNFPDVILLKEKKMGKGLAVRRGIKKAFNSKPKVVVFLDADGEKDPHDIKKILLSLEKSDFVIGRRNRMRSWKRKFFNTFTNWWIRLVTNYPISDATSGFFGIRVSALKKMRLISVGFEIETEFVLEAYRNKLDLTETPIGAPKFSKSKLGFKSMVEINMFFDRWVLNFLKTKSHKISFYKVLFLKIFCSIGLLFSYLFNLIK
jgi:dolichol-phosphate mannosyltransferase